MKILLIAGNSTSQGKPNLGLLYLASYMRKSYPDVVFKYMDHIQDSFQEIESYSPDVIGISALTVQIERVKRWTGKVKAIMDVPIIIGGPHISALPSHLPESCDMGVIGEGEETFRELIGYLLENQYDVCHDKLKRIRGIVFRDRFGNIFKAPKRPSIQSLDEIPFPARDIIDIEKYITENNVIGKHIGRGTFMFTSRGCPYNCVFCSSSAFWGKPRYNSPERVIEEIRFLVEEYKVDIIHIYDDLFAFEKKRLGKIVSFIESEGIHKKVKFGLYSRPNVFDKALCRLLKRMNVVNIDFGFESGSPRVLEFLKSGTVTIEQSMRAVRLCKDFGFEVNGTFIIGNPDETEDEMMATLRLIKEMDIEKFTHFILCPYPGTPLWEWAKAKGMVSEDMDFSQLDIKKRGGFEQQDIDRQIVLTDKVDKHRFFEIYNLIEKERENNFNYRWDRDQIKGTV